MQPEAAPTIRLFDRLPINRESGILGSRNIFFARSLLFDSDVDKENIWPHGWHSDWHSGFISGFHLEFHPVGSIPGLALMDPRNCGPFRQLFCFSWGVYAKRQSKYDMVNIMWLNGAGRHAAVHPQKKGGEK
ncbi:MAG: hypothetical protein EXR62_04145 [Chloroflexi bacterium]|nr:hypothetical protein [Chloroflexota bacterium]